MEITAIINMFMSYASIALIVMAALVIVTNVIVEVVKGLFPKLPTNYLVVTVAIVLTMLALYIAAAVLEITVMWYYAVGAVVLGFGVAYAAMVGFDNFLNEVFAKIKEIWEKLKAYKLV